MLAVLVESVENSWRAAYSVHHCAPPRPIPPKLGAIAKRAVSNVTAFWREVRRPERPRTRAAPAEPPGSQMLTLRA